MTEKCFQDVKGYGKDGNPFRSEITRSDDEKFNELHHIFVDGEDKTIGFGLNSNTIFVNPNTKYNRRDYYIKGNKGIVCEIKYEIPRQLDSFKRAESCIHEYITVYIKLFGNIYQFKQRFYCYKRERNYLYLYSG